METENKSFNGWLNWWNKHEIDLGNHRYEYLLIGVAQGNKGAINFMRFIDNIKLGLGIIIK